MPTFVRKNLKQVLVPVDSLPDWAILGIHIEPDYTIKIGAVDRSNTMTQYFRVRGSGNRNRIFARHS